MSSTMARRDSAAVAATTAVVAVATLGLLVRVALQSDRGQHWDNSAMKTVVAGRDAQLRVLSVLGYVSIGAIAVVAVVCLVVALLRGRASLAVGALVVIGGSNATTQLLKHSIFTRPDFGFGTLNSLPSGHTTVVASSVGAALLVAPSAFRPAVALAGGFATTLTGASTIVAGWHRPADVVAALAVSLAWTAAVAIVLHGPRQPSGATVAGSLVGCIGAQVFLLAVGVRPSFGWHGFVQASLVLGAVTVITAVFIVAAAAVAPAEDS
jgi:membrane-associated phospholipid phosphatase